VPQCHGGTANKLSKSPTPNNRRTKETTLPSRPKTETQSSQGTGRPKRIKITWSYPAHGKTQPPALTSIKRGVTTWTNHPQTGGCLQAKRPATRDGCQNQKAGCRNQNIKTRLRLVHIDGQGGKRKSLTPLLVTWAWRPPQRRGPQTEQERPQENHQNAGYSHQTGRTMRKDKAVRRKHSEREPL